LHHDYDDDWRNMALFLFYFVVDVVVDHLACHGLKRIFSQFPTQCHNNHCRKYYQHQQKLIVRLQ
jgi:hypothetical protein